jgi:hypothetical protein
MAGDSNLFAARCQAWTALFSAHCPSLPHMDAIRSCFRPAPERADFTPETALIFINKSTEKLGVL